MADTLVTERHADLWRLPRRTHHVRTARALAVAIAVGVGTLMLGSSTGDATGTCATRLSCTRQLLPAPITITTGRVGFRLARDGAIRRVTATTSPFPPGVTWFPATGTWYMIEHGRLVVGLGRRRLWHSQEKFTSRFTLGVIIASSRRVAFQHDRQLYLAPLGGAERPVADREMPLGWTPGGLYTYAYQGRRLLLRSDSGALVKVIARRPLGSDYHAADGRLYFIDRGVLMSAEGTRTRRLASLSRLGMSTDSWLQPVGAMAELEDSRGLVVVRANGSVFGTDAAAARPRRRREHLQLARYGARRERGRIHRRGRPASRDPRPTPGAFMAPKPFICSAPGSALAAPLFRQHVLFQAVRAGSQRHVAREWLLLAPIPRATSP